MVISAPASVVRKVNVNRETQQTVRQSLPTLSVQLVHKINNFPYRTFTEVL